MDKKADISDFDKGQIVVLNEGYSQIQIAKCLKISRHAIQNVLQCPLPNGLACRSKWGQIQRTT